MSSGKMIFERPFPLKRPYTGLMLGNGTIGLMVWGEGHLNISVGRAAFWDHRDGVPFAADFDYATLREILEKEGEAAVKQKLARTAPSTAAYRRPCVLPGGRVEIYFEGGARPIRGSINDAGELTVALSNGGSARLFVDAEDEVAFLTVQGACVETIRVVPAWDYIGSRMSKDGVAPPERWEAPGHAGFVQSLPADPALSLAVRWTRTSATIATALGDAPRRSADQRTRKSLHRARGVTRRWWRSFRADVPVLRLPDPDLQELWDYGLHKMAGMTNPSAPPATLQGAWMAEDDFAPWSNDYHFNINLQMIYGPCLGANRLTHFEPLWRMINGWMPRLRDNAARFFRAPGALMLPHAVDDRCQVVGRYWQGMIDQACVAWMARMAWLQYRYSMDRRILREIAWPLLIGAFEGFWAMAESGSESEGQLSLPVSVSPEFRGWGRDASFQLSAFHMLAQTLPQAAAVLGEPEDPRWRRVREELPPYSAMPLAKEWGVPELQPRIVLWQGQDLTESHRHHSHLAGLYPFETLDPRDEAHRVAVRHGILRWVEMGQGQWVGWSFPWAAQIFARLGEGDAAWQMLRTLRLLFTNEGGQTLHNAHAIGVSSWIHGPFMEPPERSAPRTYDQMQMDAAMGALSAIMDMLVHTRKGAVHVLPARPRDWTDFEFDGIRVEGAFLIGATVRGGRVIEIRVRSLAGGPITLCHGWGESWSVDGASGNGPVWSAQTKKGHTYCLRLKPLRISSTRRSAQSLEGRRSDERTSGR